VNFLAHLKRLHEVLPDPTSGVVTDFNAKLASLPVFTAGTGRYPTGTWGNLNEVLLNLNGKVETRRVASELREKLLAEGVYTVESRGADLPDQFSYQLSSKRLNPYETPRNGKLPSGKTNPVQPETSKTEPSDAKPGEGATQTETPKPAEGVLPSAENAVNPNIAKSGGGVP